LQELVGRSPNPLFCIVPMQASRFLQNALSALRRSAQPSRNVMFAGIGIASQQAEHARQICKAVRVLAFVRTKALLADAGAINKCKLDFL
jgi:hypothetical protein